MKKIFFSIIIVLILIFGVLIINNILTVNDIEIVKEESTTSTNDSSIYHEYILDLNTTNNIDNISILYHDNKLYINENEINNITYINELITIYENVVVVLTVTENDNNEVLIYDYISNTFNRIIEYDGLTFNIDEDIIYEDIGIIINFSKLKDNYISNTYICDIKDDSMIISKSVEYYYDSYNNTFDKEELLYSSTVSSYKKANNIC